MLARQRSLASRLRSGEVPTRINQSVSIPWAILLRVCAVAFVQVEKQIEQMVKFIKQEAEEKSNEIKVSAEEVSRTHSDLERMCQARDVCSATPSGTCLPLGKHCPCKPQPC